MYTATVVHEIGPETLDPDHSPSCVPFPGKSRSSGHSLHVPSRAHIENETWSPLNNRHSRHARQARHPGMATAGDRLISLRTNPPQRSSSDKHHSLRSDRYLGTMDKETTPTPNQPPGAKYRGAVVEVSALPAVRLQCPSELASDQTACSLLR